MGGLLGPGPVTGAFRQRVRCAARVLLPAWLVASTLAVTACGAGRPSVSPASSRVAATASARPADSGPESVRTGPYDQIFSDPLPANPAAARVVSDFRRAMILIDRSETQQRQVVPLTDYVVGDAYVHIDVAIVSGQQRNLVLAGSDRIYRLRVASLTSTRATITTCDDGGKVEEVDRGTGRVDTRYFKPAANPFIFETWTMVRKSRNWAIGSFTLAAGSTAQSKACARGH